MTATYDITTNVGKVRLAIGDVDIGNYIFTDEEIGIFLTDQSDNIKLAAADAMEAWAAKYAANADSEKIGDYAYTQKMTDKMLKLAANFRETDASMPYLTWAEMDLSGVEDTTISEDIE